MSYRRSLTSAVLVALCSIGLSHAGPSDLPPATAAIPGSQVQQEADRYATADFGTGVNILQIPAAAFTSRHAAATLEYFTPGYVYQSAGAQPDPSYWAPVFLPTGALITWLDLYSYDSDATYDISAAIRAWTGFNSGNVGFFDVVSVTSSGSGGFQYTSASTTHTVNNDVRYGGGSQYSVVMFIPINGNTLRWKGVDIWWYRQIAPAPATASFTDVPTSAQFFREVEALKASGITGGCTSTTFCPDTPVTRRQMAAFLSRALGLGY